MFPILPALLVVTFLLAPLAARAQYAPEPVYIEQGVHNVFTDRERIAPLRIVTPSGTFNYFVKVIDAATKEAVLTAYILGGQTLQFEVPTGSYRIRYATGETWYGDDLLFGETTAYAEADETLNFAITGDQVSGFTIELIRQEGGNLDTRSLSPGEF